MNAEEFVRRCSALYHGTEWQTNFATRTGTSPRTIRHWAMGDRRVPGTIVCIIDLFERHPHEIDRYPPELPWRPA